MIKVQSLARVWRHQIIFSHAILCVMLFAGTGSGGEIKVCGTLDSSYCTGLAEVRVTSAEVRIHPSVGDNLASDASFDDSLRGPSVATMAEARWRLGDFDGNGLDDLLIIHAGDYGNGSYGHAQAWIHSSNGNGFDKSEGDQDLGYRFTDSRQQVVGDFDGDGRDDLALIYEGPTGKASVWIHSSNGNGFDYTRWQRLDANFSNSQRWEVGDFDGDGRDDMVLVYDAGTYGATAWIYRSDGRKLVKVRSLRLGVDFEKSDHWEVGDIDGDGRDDLLRGARMQFSLFPWRLTHPTTQAFISVGNSFDLPANTVTLDDLPLGHLLLGNFDNQPGDDGYYVD